ncbi:MAG: lytic murein transglycosylase [Patescibacteria group bacterium]
MHRIIRYIFSFLIIFSMVLGGFSYKIPSASAADQALQNAQADRARLQQELSALEQEIAQKQKELSTQKGQSVSLSRDIAILTTQIKKAKLDIQSKNLVIKKLGGEITEKNKTIETLTEKIENEKESLAQLMRKEREIDERSLVAMILSQEKISESLGDVDAFASIKKGIKSSVDEIRGVKTQTESEKKNLEEKKNQEIDVKAQLESAQREVETSEAQKQQLLSISKNKEKEYQKVLDDKAKRRAEILSMLFNLRDVSAIPFGRALEYANLAEEITGIRPAFLLAILTQESNLGTNQGSCYVTNMDTGVGVSSKSGKVLANVMKPTRDTKPFQDITASLGRDPYKTLVSCPIGGLGYGGAMGPSQFIPSTWTGLKSRIAKTLGVVTPDPWNPKDAFIASALFLTDLGAKNGSITSERTAACRYYGGGTKCTTTTASYGDSVMKKATNIQTTMIDPLQN